MIDERERDRDRDFDRERETLYRLERERETISRLRERRWLDTAFREETMSRVDRDRQQPESSKKPSSSISSPVTFAEELQFWTDKVRYYIMFCFKYYAEHIIRLFGNH